MHSSTGPLSLTVSSSLMLRAGSVLISPCCSRSLGQRPFGGHNLFAIDHLQIDIDVDLGPRPPLTWPFDLGRASHRWCLTRQAAQVHAIGRDAGALQELAHDVVELELASAFEAELVRGDLFAFDRSIVGLGAPTMAGS